MVKRMNVVVFGLLLLTVSCLSSDNKGEGDTTNARLLEEKMQNERELNELIEVINSIEENLAMVKEQENILSFYDAEDMPNAKDRIQADVEALVRLLNENKYKVEHLEGLIAKSKGEVSGLQKMVKRIKAENIEQAKEIVKLKNALWEQEIMVAGLVELMQEMEVEIEDVKGRAKEDLANKDAELHRSWYLVGKKKELKEYKVINTGGLFTGDKGLLEQEFDKAAFTEIDNRTVFEIPLGGGRVKVLSTHPEGSYEIINDEGNQLLNIKNPTKFWSISKYLVIQN